MVEDHQQEKLLGELQLVLLPRKFSNYFQELRWVQTQNDDGNKFPPRDLIVLIEHDVQRDTLYGLPKLNRYMDYRRSAYSINHIIIHILPTCIVSSYDYEL